MTLRPTKFDDKIWVEVKTVERDPVKLASISFLPKKGKTRVVLKTEYESQGGLFFPVLFSDGLRKIAKGEYFIGVIIITASNKLFSIVLEAEHV